ncbi:MAG TPA: putative metalloprotease CJM1_0395 family protein, partial [Bacillota bacterium]|nr:putative metalloprotease CJM1_0395 family protein [Bacillota bacterium]
QPSGAKFGGEESNPIGDNASNDPVRLSLSPEAKRLLKSAGDPSQNDRASKEKVHSTQSGKDPTKATKSSKNERLSESEQKMVDELVKRDQQVRTHEAAHAAAAGSYAIGGPSYEFQQGPDGKNYAVGGHVKLDMKPESTPEATIAKMQTIRRAALAPADPSGADRSVAASAAKMEMDARREETEEFAAGRKDNHQSEKIRSGTAKRITVKDGLYGTAKQFNYSGRLMDQTA